MSTTLRFAQRTAAEKRELDRGRAILRRNLDGKEIESPDLSDHKARLQKFFGKPLPKVADGGIRAYFDISDNIGVRPQKVEMLAIAGMTNPDQPISWKYGSFGPDDEQASDLDVAFKAYPARESLESTKALAKMLRLKVAADLASKYPVAESVEVTETKGSKTSSFSGPFIAEFIEGSENIIWKTTDDPKLQKGTARQVLLNMLHARLVKIAEANGVPRAEYLVDVVDLNSSLPRKGKGSDTNLLIGTATRLTTGAA